MVLQVLHPGLWFQIQVWLPSNPRLKDLVGTLHIGRLTLNKDIKSLEEALQNPASQMNLSRSNIPPTTPINSYGLGVMHLANKVDSALPLAQLRNIIIQHLHV